MTEQVSKKPKPKEKQKKQERKSKMMTTQIVDLENMGIKMGDIFSFDNTSFNLGWDQIIKWCNFNADKVVLTWKNTLEEAIEIIKDFLL